MDNDIITPWDTKCTTDGFDYDNISTKFGIEHIDDDIINRFKNIVGEVHPWIKRGLVFGHRDLNIILDDIEIGKQIILYTGRGPSSMSMHLGHLIPFELTLWLQKVINNSITFIQIADNEKFYFKNLNMEEISEYSDNNIKDIISFGFDPDRTFIYYNSKHSKSKQDITSNMMKIIPIKRLQAIFGLTNEDSIGKYVWPIHQIAGSYSEYYDMNNVRCLSIYAIDQDPYFRLSRDIANRINFLKPCSIITKFLPSLNNKSKMSSTFNEYTIFLDDSKKIISKKIKSKAFSGGGDTLENHKKYGANIDIDIPYQYLLYFEYDNENIEYIKDKYSSGEMMTSEIKNILINNLYDKLIHYQNMKNNITPNIIDLYIMN